MTMILDGRKLAAEIKAKLSAQVRSSSKKFGLGTVLVGNDPSSQAYVSGKHRDCQEIGISSIKVELPSSTTEDQILSAVQELNINPSCTGFIVQLPLPSAIDVNRVLSAIDPSKDADGLHPLNLGRLVLNQAAPLPCTPQAIIELVSANGIDWDGKDVVVLGRGTTVGRPLGLMLTQKAVNATVTLTHTATRDLADHTRRADIVIAALGKPHFLSAQMIKTGAVVIDVGLTRVDGALKGDVHPDVYEIAGAYSPAPGGIGPMTRAMLLENVIKLGQSHAE